MLRHTANLFRDEPGEQESEYFASVYPEAGAHFWITPRVRLTASAAHHFTSATHDNDQWVFGLGLSLLSPLDYAAVPDGKFSLLERPESWQPASSQEHDTREFSATMAPTVPTRDRPVERTPDGRPLPPL